MSNNSFESDLEVPKNIDHSDSEKLYNNVTPDVIHIFQEYLEKLCGQKISEIENFFITQDEDNNTEKPYTNFSLQSSIITGETHNRGDRIDTDFYLSQAGIEQITHILLYYEMKRLINEELSKQIPRNDKIDKSLELYNTQQSGVLEIEDNRDSVSHAIGLLGRQDNKFGKNILAQLRSNKERRNNLAPYKKRLKKLKQAFSPKLYITDFMSGISDQYRKDFSHLYKNAQNNIKGLDIGFKYTNKIKLPEKNALSEDAQSTKVEKQRYGTKKIVFSLLLTIGISSIVLSLLHTNHDDNTQGNISSEPEKIEKDKKSIIQAQSTQIFHNIVDQHYHIGGIMRDFNHKLRGIVEFNLGSDIAGNFQATLHYDHISEKFEVVIQNILTQDIYHSWKIPVSHSNTPQETEYNTRLHQEVSQYINEHNSLRTMHHDLSPVVSKIARDVFGYKDMDIRFEYRGTYLYIRINSSQGNEKKQGVTTEFDIPFRLQGTHK